MKMVSTIRILCKLYVSIRHTLAQYMNEQFGKRQKKKNKQKKEKLQFKIESKYCRAKSFKSNRCVGWFSGFETSKMDCENKEISLVFQIGGATFFFVFLRSNRIVIIISMWKHFLLWWIVYLTSIFHSPSHAKVYEVDAT